MSIVISGYSIKAPKSDNVKEFHYNLDNIIDMTSTTKRYPLNYIGLPPNTGTIPTVK